MIKIDVEMWPKLYILKRLGSEKTNVKSRIQHQFLIKSILNVLTTSVLVKTNIECAFITSVVIKTDVFYKKINNNNSRE